MAGLAFLRAPGGGRGLENHIKSPRGITATVRGARQMGNSSLLARAHAAALGQGQAVAYIDFQLIDRDKLCDLDSLLRYLAARLARALKTAQGPEDYWDPMFGPKDSLTEFVEEAVLEPATDQVSLLFDEADRVFEQSAYRDDFFATLRAWTNRRATHPQWAKLNLVIAHSRAGTVDPAPQPIPLQRRLPLRAPRTRPGRSPGPQWALWWGPRRPRGWGAL